MTKSQVKLAVLLSCLFSFLGTFAWSAFKSESKASRNSSGTYSLPAGNPVVSGTTITTTWANATLPDIGTEITNSLDRQGRGAMTAPLQLASGSSGAPGLTFSAEPTSGLYRAASNDIREVIAGTWVQKWTATGVTIQAGTTGAGATVSGGSSGGIGVLGIGKAASLTATTTSHGVVGLAGATNGFGVFGLGAGNTYIPDAGTLATGGLVGQNVGVIGLGGSAGPGVVGLGTGSYNGGYFEGLGAGYGSTSRGGTGLAGVLAYNGTNASATVSQDALAAMNGAIVLNGANPNSNVAFINRLTPTNIPKAWATVTTGASPSVGGGFNITSATCSSNVVTITFAQAMADANYAVIATVQSLPGGTYITNKGTTTFKINVFNTAAGTATNLCTGSTVVDFVVFGAQ